MAGRKRTWEEINADLLAAIDVPAEYAAMGVEFAGGGGGGGEPNRGGWLACYAVGREDRNPSAAVNVRTGRYLDSGGEGRSLSLWDFCAEFGPDADWQSARKRLADKAGVSLGRGRPPASAADKLHFDRWVPALVAMACRHRPGVTPEAVRANGGELAQYPKKSKKHKVVAIPAYNPDPARTLAEPPVGYQIWDIGGRELPIWGKRPGGEPAGWAKIKTVTKTGIMGLWGLARMLGDPQRREAIELVWCVEGPSDMLALWAAIPGEQRERHVVVANSGGANQRPEPFADLFAGLPVAVVRDADAAGEASAVAWADAISRVAASVRVVHLPFARREKGGADVRDFLNGLEADELATAETETAENAKAGEAAA